MQLDRPNAQISCAAVIAAILIVAPVLADSRLGLCCPADLARDRQVDGADLGVLLGSWGDSGDADLDGSGMVDAADLGILLGAWGLCPVDCMITRVVGSVQLADGTPVELAVVSSDLGGEAVSEADGSFAFLLEIGKGVDTIVVSAAAIVDGALHLGQRTVRPVVLDGVSDAGVIVIQPEEQCTPTWLPTFGGVETLNGRVFALATFDDGSGLGAQLIAGGSFTLSGSQSMRFISRWTGHHWESLGEGLSDGVRALVVFDDGSGAGPALYAGGFFTEADGVVVNGIAKWNGAAWSPVGGGFGAGWGPTAVMTLAVLDDGSGEGPRLYAGGDFTTADGVTVNGIAKWSGSRWTPIGDGVNGVVRAIAMFDDGSTTGPQLHVGGTFTHAGGVPANRIARWDGGSWLPLGSGIQGSDSVVRALVPFDDGSGLGPALFVGGNFTSAGGVAANRIARWSGGAWSGVGSGFTTGVAVYALAVHDDDSGAGPQLFAGGAFTHAGVVTANRIAKWTGSSWQALGVGTSGAIEAMVTLDTGAGGPPALCVGGDFFEAGGLLARRTARWSGDAWSPIGNGVPQIVRALASFDDGCGVGPSLFVGGDFRNVGGERLSHIARWNGHSWSALGNGLNNLVFALVVHDDGMGGGSALYAGGGFNSGGGPSDLSRAAKWDGTAWSNLGAGVNSFVHALASMDGGVDGPALFAGGHFSSAGGLPATNVAMWNGMTWSPLGTGVNGIVRALAAFDDGSGPALFVGGEFTNAGGVPASCIAKWDGTTWSAVGTGLSLSGGGDMSVKALVVVQHGPGGTPALCVAGTFSHAGGAPASNIALWDGAHWSSLGTGLNHDVMCLVEVGSDSPLGPAIYAGGFFTASGATPINRIARWTGTSWASMGEGMAGGTVNSLASFEDGALGGPALFMGGGFIGSPSDDAYLARWGCAPPANREP